MMKNKITFARGALSLVLFPAALLVGCGGGDDEETNDDGGGRSNIECVEADGVTDAVCVNDTDCSSVEDGSHRATAKDCLLNDCADEDDQATCVANCLVMVNGASQECADCYGTSAECSSDNCFTECATDGDSPGCVSCQEENGCSGTFFSCSGLKNPDAE
jgi:hypothetical protein